MEGDWRVRLCPVEPDATRPVGYCALCREHVVDARGLESSELAGLYRRHEGRVCVEVWATSNGDVPRKPSRPPSRPRRGRLVPTGPVEPPAEERDPEASDAPSPAP